MKLNRRVFVLGGAHTPYIGKMNPDFIWKRHADFGKRENPTLEAYLHQATAGALKSAGVAAEQIDKAYVGNFAGELFANQGHLGAMLAREQSGLVGKPVTRVEAACASGGLSVIEGVQAIQAGMNLVLAVGAEVQTTVNAREGGGYLARASHWATERDLDEFTFPAMFARRMKYYKEAHGVSEEDIAHTVVKAYANGNKNPLAHMRTVEMTLEKASAPSDRNPNFLRNEEFGAHLKVSDCSQVSDGGSGMVLASEEAVRAMGLNPDDLVEFMAYSHAVAPLGKVEDYTRLVNTKAACDRVYADAGLAASDMEIAEVHDCFSIAEVQMTEALGFAAYGKGWELAKSGASHIDGKIPVNTGGGLVSFGHPTGATGVKQIFEVVRQMKGECGDYQVPTSPRYGITTNMGGDDRTTACTILRNNAAFGS